ncbi:MAG: hypothetical protein ABSH20_29740 [Tepidisphaeraceae bacterium]
MSRRLVSWLVLAAMAVSGCVGGGGASESPATAAPSPTANMTPSIANYTTIAVTLVVNGSVVEVVPPGGYQDPIKAALPGLPWTVETRSPSGRVLSSMTVRSGDVWQTSYPSGGGAAHGDAVRVDLSCGRIDVWSGPPLLGPPPGPGTSGDCA